MSKINDDEFTLKGVIAYIKEDYIDTDNPHDCLACKSVCIIRSNDDDTVTVDSFEGKETGGLKRMTIPMENLELATYKDSDVLVTAEKAWDDIMRIFGAYMRENHLSDTKYEMLLDLMVKGVRQSESNFSEAWSLTTRTLSRAKEKYTKLNDRLF